MGGGGPDEAQGLRGELTGNSLQDGTRLAHKTRFSGTPLAIATSARLDDKLGG